MHFAFLITIILRLKPPHKHLNHNLFIFYIFSVFFFYEQVLGIVPATMPFYRYVGETLD